MGYRAPKMKDFHFSKIYFNKLIFDDEESKVRVVVKETPSIEITEEGYSLRIETRHYEDKHIHRDYAIEHHLKQPKHSSPHIQFKFHTEEIGTFWVHLHFKGSEEYKKAILGFIYKIKNVLRDLEKYREGITSEILVLELVNKLSREGKFLDEKLFESIVKYKVEFQNYGYTRDKIANLRKNPLLIEFLGEDNVKRIIASYNSKK